MEIRISKSGKFFTPHVSKEAVPTLVQTADRLIIGTVHIHADRRLKDDLNGSSERFLAITDAQVYTKDAERLLYSSTLVLVGYDHIVALSPIEAIGDVSGLSAARELLKEA